ncbi:MAG: hypothetical protein GXP10_11230 [Gammaproteobacteria bacterium]|nr:hypothetical protein [Gammaproteobacteria bacterium]
MNVMNRNNLRLIRVKSKAKNTAESVAKSAAKKVLLSLSLAMICAFAQADSGTDTSGSHAIKVPPHAMSMEDVERFFPKPISRLPAVGEPPISRWIYDQYTVYFEGRRVIHSVMHRPEKNSHQ